MKRILVTGGSGFIGSHLRERLLKDGNEACCLDNYFTGSKFNIIRLLDNPYFEIIRHDVISPFFIEVDEIYNLACPASPIRYQYNPIKTIKTSIMGAINMLGLAKRKKAKILQASTSEECGDPIEHPQTEECLGNVNPIGLRSCYDEGRRCAESLFVNYNLQNKVRIKIIRIFNTYGPKMLRNGGRVVSKFIVQALENKSNEFSILELARKIIEITNSKSEIIFLPLPQDDPTQRQPDIKLAKEMFDNWSPKVELDYGLIKTIEYFKNNKLYL